MLAPFVRLYLEDYGRFADVQNKTKISRNYFLDLPLCQNGPIQKTFSSWQSQRNEEGRGDCDNKHD